MKQIKNALSFHKLMLWKIFSTGTQLYLASLIATNGSSQDPWLQLKTIAHFGAIVAALRGVDALIDPAFQKLNPFTHEEKKAIAAETSTTPTP